MNRMQYRIRVIFVANAAATAYTHAKVGGEHERVINPSNRISHHLITLRSTGLYTYTVTYLGVLSLTTSHQCSTLLLSNN